MNHLSTCAEKGHRLRVAAHDPRREGQRRRPSVLIIDDDEALSRTLVLCLRLDGFDAKFVVRGADGVECALADQPDVIILDLHLADGDVPGVVILEYLRAKYPELPIIVVTGWYLTDEHERQARALGVSDYLFKPVDDSQLVASLRAVLDGPTARGTKQLGDPVGRWEPKASAESRCVVDAGYGESSAGEFAYCINAFIKSRLRYLVRGIQHAFPRVWTDVIVEQAEDALLEFLAKMKRGVWPVRRTLDGHLRQAVWRNVRDQVQAAARRAANEARYAREQAHFTYVPHAERDLQTVWRLAHSGAEKEALYRWLEAESSARIAEALGVSHLPTSEQLREVKRFKDRLKRRAQRGN